MNAYPELVESWWVTRQGSGASQGTGQRGPGRCSAFIATGNRTEGGRIVMAHNAWDRFVVGDTYNVILDITPATNEGGSRILMQAGPGYAHVSSTGNKIACYELGTGEEGSDAGHPGVLVEGPDYFVGSNIAHDLKIRNQQCTDPGQHYDVRGNGARRVRLEHLVTSQRLTADIAKTVIADHHDVYVEKDDWPSSRTICGHLDLDDGRYGNHGQPAYYPWGANGGKVIEIGFGKPVDLTFHARWGNSCGLPFDPVGFVANHPQYAELGPYMTKRDGHDWTTFPTT